MEVWEERLFSDFNTIRKQKGWIHIMQNSNCKKTNEWVICHFSEEKIQPLLFTVKRQKQIIFPCQSQVFLLHFVNHEMLSQLHSELQL